MKAVLPIALHTVRELIRNKLLYLLVVFSVLLIAGSILLAQLTVGQWERIINDVGLATVQLSGALVAILVGVGLIAGEIDRRTVYVTLSKPVTRAAFVWGRYLGLCANLALLVGVMGAVLAAVLLATGYPMSATSFSALVLIYVELCVLSAFAVVFSSFTTQTLGVIFSASVFIVGHLAGDLVLLADRLTGASRAVVRAIAGILPNLDLLNLKSQAANQVAVAPSFVASSAAYGLVYSAIAVAFAAFVFKRRDLK
jgi:Cu-processing system permease protein